MKTTTKQLIGHFKHINQRVSDRSFIANRMKVQRQIWGADTFGKMHLAFINRDQIQRITWDMQDKIKILRAFFDRSCKHIPCILSNQDGIEISGGLFQIVESEGEFTLLYSPESLVVHEIYTDTDFERVCKQAVMSWVERQQNYFIQCRETERQGKETF
jgi:hypothetical protein